LAQVGRMVPVLATTTRAHSYSQAIQARIGKASPMHRAIHNQWLVRSTRCTSCVSRFCQSTSLLVLGPWRWLATLRKYYGLQFLFALGIANFLLKGIATQLQTSSTWWLLNEYNIDGPRMQILTSVAHMPWTITPLIGLVSDMYPIRGFKKAPYIVAASLAGVLGTSVLGLSLPGSTSVACVVASLFAIHVQAATVDLLTESAYTGIMQDKPKLGAELVSFVSGCVSCGNILAVGAVGWLLMHVGAKNVFLMCSLPAAAMIWPALRNHLQEIPVSRESVSRARTAMKDQREVIGLCFCIGVSTTLLSILCMVCSSTKIMFVAALGTLTFLVLSLSLVLRPEIAKVAVFFLMQAVCTPSLGGASFFFFTDSPGQYLAGPHFSTEFYSTVLGLVSPVMCLLGIAAFSSFVKDRSYQFVYMITSGLAIFLSMLDVVLFSRANLWFGIPDVLFVMGSAASLSVIYQMQSIPGVMLMSRVCPKNMQSTVVALLVSCYSVGMQLAGCIDAQVLDWFNVRPTGALNEGGQFQNFWKAQLTCTALQTVTLVLIRMLVPSQCHSDTLLLNQKESSATAGSLLSRLLSRRRCRRQVSFARSKGVQEGDLTGLDDDSVGSSPSIF